MTRLCLLFGLLAVVGILSAQADPRILADGDLTAIRHAQPGDIFVLRGQFRQPLLLNRLQGTPDQPIIIRGEDAELVDSLGQGTAIRGKDTAHIVLEDIEVHDVHGHGLKCERCQDITVRNLHIHHVGNTGMVFRFSSGLTLVNNTINDTGQRDNGEGLYLWAVTDVLIRDNDIFRTHDEGINIKAQSRDVTIVANTIHDVLRRPASPRFSFWHWLVPLAYAGGNLSEDSGIGIRDNGQRILVQGNTIERIPAYGIRVRDGDVQILDNTIRDARVGIRVDDGRGVTVHNNALHAVGRGVVWR